MKTKLKILHLEDTLFDVEMVERELRKASIEFDKLVVDNKEAFEDALLKFSPDLVLSDHSLASFDSIRALEMVKKLVPDVPFILVTSTVSEEFAADIIKLGAADYILKDRLIRLPAAVNAAVKHSQAEKEKRAAALSLKQSEENYRTIMERLTDGFVAVDKNWNYTYVNKEAGAILNRRPEDLVGKNIWSEFPESVGKAFHEAAMRSIHEQQYKHIEAYHEPFDSWLENHIYPSPDGLSIFFRDITERKKTERAIQESEEKYRTLIERVSDGFFAMDLDWRITYINSVAEQLLERPIGYLSGKKMTEEFPEGIGRAFYNGYLEALVTGSNVQLQEYSIALDKWISAGIYPSPTGVSVFFRDITQQIKAEKQREFDNNNLHALINNTHDLIWSVDRNHKLISSNKAFDDLLKKITGNILEKGSNILLSQFNAAQLNRYKTYYARAFNGEMFTEIEYDNTQEEFWSEISFFPIYEANEVVGTACFSRNITDRKKAEETIKISLQEKKAMAERMSVILNTLPANIALLDKEGFILEVNESWKKFADSNGFTGTDHGIGSNYLSAAELSVGKEQQDGKNVSAGIKAVLQNHTKDFVYEYACNSPKLKRWFRMVVTPLHEKEYIGAVVMHIDISEVRRLEKERLDAKLEERRKITIAILQGQEKERNHIGKELHDNINQILAGTKLYLGIAGRKDDAIKELMKYPMELIDSSIEEIRLLCSRMVTPLKNINLEEMIRDILHRFQLNTIIETDLIYTLSNEAIPDELQLNIYRIIQEQLNNILKYAAAQHVSIAITAANKKINISVEDDGKGFDVEKKRSGIGISNMINRVETFKGEMKIESSPGKGCKTTISIPLPKSR